MKRHIRLNTYFTVQKVAEYFGVTEGTVREWAKTKALPAMKVGKQWFFPRGVICNIQSMNDALYVLGDNSKPSTDKMFDILVDNDRIEVKSSTLYYSEKRGFYWKFTNIHSPEQSDFYLLLGYNDKRSELDSVFYIPTKDLFEKLPELLTPRQNVDKVRPKTHILEGRGFFVYKEDPFFSKYFFDPKRQKMEIEDLQLEHLREDAEQAERK